MLIVAILVIVLSFLGLPWYVAATVSALAHVMSLRKESECTAPGEKPTFLGVRYFFNRKTDVFCNRYFSLPIIKDLVKGLLVRGLISRNRSYSLRST